MESAPREEQLEPQLQRALAAGFVAAQDADGLVAAAAVGPLLCLAGLATCDEEVKALCSQGAPARYAQADVLALAARVKSQGATREAMVAAFRVFDAEGRGFLTKIAVRQVFEQQGAARLSSELTDALCHAADPSHTGRVDYAALVDAVFADYERLQQRRAAEGRQEGHGGPKGPGGAVKRAPKK